MTNRSDWSSLNRAETIISVEVSLANEKCTGNHLRAILDWIGIGWSEIQFSIGDTLHRFNVYAGELRTGNGRSEMEMAEEYTRNLGNDWMESNAAWIGSLPIDTRIIRWDEWRAHPNFLDETKRFRDALSADPEFAEAVYRDIQQFNERRGTTNSKEHHLAVQSEYILEELAVYAIQSEEKSTINIYPGSPLGAIKYCENVSGLCALNRHYGYVKLSSLS
ncbi:tRNA-dependent cyclodipeptide synthase [Halomonas sp. TRM85114]|nr:tRNA-dependent cyclodipeptide synthase [Halomonas jincaotanensis]